MSASASGGTPPAAVTSPGEMQNDENLLLAFFGILGLTLAVLACTGATVNGMYTTSKEHVPVGQSPSSSKLTAIVSASTRRRAWLRGATTIAFTESVLLLFMVIAGNQSSGTGSGSTAAHHQHRAENSAGASSAPPGSSTHLRDSLAMWWSLTTIPSEFGLTMKWNLYGKEESLASTRFEYYGGGGSSSSPSGAAVESWERSFRSYFQLSEELTQAEVDAMYYKQEGENFRVGKLGPRRLLSQHQEQHAGPGGAGDSVGVQVLNAKNRRLLQREINQEANNGKTTHHAQAIEVEAGGGARAFLEVFSKRKKAGNQPATSHDLGARTGRGRHVNHGSGGAQLLQTDSRSAPKSSSRPAQGAASRPAASSTSLDDWRRFYFGCHEAGLHASMYLFTCVLVRLVGSLLSAVRFRLQVVDTSRKAHRGPLLLRKSSREQTKGPSRLLHEHDPKRPIPSNFAFSGHQLGGDLVAEEHEAEDQDDASSEELERDRNEFRDALFRTTAVSSCVIVFWPLLVLTTFQFTDRCPNAFPDERAVLVGGAGLWFALSLVFTSALWVVLHLAAPGLGAAPKL